EPRLSLTFTCTVPDCGTRSSHEFTKRSYERGIVIVQCPGCKNRHLIADHLGWFKESTEEGKLKTVEDLMRAKGEQVRRGSTDGSLTIEY
ncbi:zf-DNL-domain-containing protein, partial [Trametopsis cervina]